MHKAEQPVHATLALLDALMGEFRSHDFTVRLWDGSTWPAGPVAAPRFTLVLRHPGALRRMFLPLNELTFGEAFIYDDFDIEGDLRAFLALGFRLLERRRTLPEKLRAARLLMSLPANGQARTGRGAARLSGTRHSIERDRQAVAFHYDISNPFYALWLDRQMVYTCAYFETPDDDLDTAQARKLEYVCRKLRLRPGERLLDLGCGWGGLVLHAARNYGVEAHGITLSRAQADFAGDWIARTGLSASCRVDLQDYREIDAPGHYDKIASIGMFEQVGEDMLPAYFEQAWKLLRPGGVFLNHGIACPPRAPVSAKRRRTSFIDRYVFPDGELVPINTSIRIAEACGFEVRDVENLREHYALTARHWAQRLEARRDEACRITDETTYRIWRLYMAASSYFFETGRRSIYQTLLVKPDQGRNTLPLTRDDWYRPYEATPAFARSAASDVPG